MTFVKIICSTIFVMNILSTITLQGETILQKMSELKKDDEVIFDLHQSISAIRVMDTSSSSIQLRVATATKDILARENIASWHQWVQKEAPGAISDETIRIYTDGSNIIEGQKTGRIQCLVTLLRLDLTPIPNSQRRKAGPPPLPGELDLRPIFHPKIIMCGNKIDTHSSAFSIHWPNDGTELSSRILVVYFPHSPQAVHGLPYWIESQNAAYHIHVIDSFHAFQVDQKEGHSHAQFCSSSKTPTSLHS